MAQTEKNGEPRLMPTPKALEKALAQSAQRAQSLAKAFGVKVPVAPGKTTRVSTRNAG
jgi:uncharacterized protein YggE